MSRRAHSRSVYVNFWCLGVNPAKRALSIVLSFIALPAKQRNDIWKLRRMQLHSCSVKQIGFKTAKNSSKKLIENTVLTYTLLSTCLGRVFGGKNTIHHIPLNRTLDPRNKRKFSHTGVCVFFNMWNRPPPLPPHNSNLPQNRSPFAPLESDLGHNGWMKSDFFGEKNKTKEKINPGCGGSVDLILCANCASQKLGTFWCAEVT